MLISNKTYDILKWIAQILLPAFGTLYAALAPMWGLSYGDQVVGTILAVDTFLGALLGISSKKYNAATGSEENQNTNRLIVHYYLKILDITGPSVLVQEAADAGKF